MKKAELIYFTGCPSVPTARKALHDAGIEFIEVVQDELTEGDPRRKYCSPSLLIDGEVIIGARVEEASCALDRWDTPETAKLLGELKVESRAIGCCIRVGESSAATLTKKQRWARMIVGVGFLGLAFATRGLWPLAVVLGWFGASHAVAGVSGYAGCPELGAIPSALLGRSVATRCRPWEWLDQRIQ